MNGTAERARNRLLSERKAAIQKTQPGKGLGLVVGSGGPRQRHLGEFPPGTYLTDFVDLHAKARRLDPAFLHEKYVVEGRSIAEIAAQTFSSRAGVRAALKRAGVALRTAHVTGARNASVAYGRKRVHGRQVPHQGEGRTVALVLQLRDQGLSLRKIAAALNTLGLPTKQRGRSWHPQMVQRLLDRGPGRRPTGSV